MFLRFATGSDRFMDAYQKGLSGVGAAWAAKKYRGHRVLPPDIVAEVKKHANKINNIPYPRNPYGTIVASLEPRDLKHSRDTNPRLDKGTGSWLWLSYRSWKLVMALIGVRASHPPENLGQYQATCVGRKTELE